MTNSARQLIFENDCIKSSKMMGSMLTSKESPPPRKSSKKEPSKKSHLRGELGFSKPYRRVTLLNTS
jgi:hypothetical protein